MDLFILGDCVSGGWLINISLLSDNPYVLEIPF